eukprot:2177914-Rhodomonas_salina.2
MVQPRAAALPSRSGMVQARAFFAADLRGSDPRTQTRLGGHGLRAGLQAAPPHSPTLLARPPPPPSLGSGSVSIPAIAHAHAPGPAAARSESLAAAPGPGPASAPRCDSNLKSESRAEAESASNHWQSEPPAESRSQTQPPSLVQHGLQPGSEGRARAGRRATAGGGGA